MVKPQDNLGFSIESRQQHIDSAVSEGVVKYGKGIVYGSNIADVKGTADEVTPQVKEFDGTDANAKFAGIATDSTKPGLDDNQYNDKQSVSVLRKGIVMVEVDEAVEFGDQVALMPSGNFGKQQVGGGTSGTYAINITDAQFKSSGAAGDTVKLEINLPGAYEVVEL